MPLETLDFNPVTAFAGMFQDPRNRWFGMYLASSVILAFVIYEMQARRDPAVRKEGFFGFAFPKELYGHPSARVDYWFYVINRLLFLGVFAVLALSSQLSFEVTTNLAGFVLSPPLVANSPVAGLLVTTLASVLALDFGLWLAHYLFHRIPVLWEFHKVHHSAEVLTPFTAGRVHPVDDGVSYLLAGLFSGAATGLCQAVFGPEALMMSVLQLNAVMFLFYMFGFHLRHSHVWLPYTGWLGRILVSPAHHQVHHSSAERHWDRNMGFVFAVWDWMFGTLHVPAAKREEFALGIGGEEKEFNSVWRLYAVPFVKGWRLMAGGTSPQGSSAKEHLAAQLGFSDVDPAQAGEQRAREPGAGVSQASRGA
jgi:sterol desaturase/sphingolipid hydroxylase (fatty acid hydroxylase superfamily)